MIRFRTARAEDAEMLTVLAHAAKQTWNYPQEWMALWKSALTVSAEQITEWDFQVAECEDGILGFFAVSVESNDGELEHFWVAPNHEGRGYGRLLFERVLLHCREAGVVTLRVVSDPNAEGFYRRLGGVVVGRVRSLPAPRTLPVLEFKLLHLGERSMA